VNVDGEPRVLNLHEAHFECVYPECGGICCRDGRPVLEPDEVERLERHLPRFLPRLRASARERIERDGFLDPPAREGERPTLAVDDGWCAFFHDGCVLHVAGAEEGDPYRYKPWRCATFPLERVDRETWEVRQWGRPGEVWDLFCLNPAESPLPAAETLEAELARARVVQARGYPLLEGTPARMSAGSTG